MFWTLNFLLLSAYNALYNILSLLVNYLFILSLSYTKDTAYKSYIYFSC